ncbi:MAG: zf-HC2 domain-containing protein [bacterium]|nr:zf-HC2 domain-containing protein [bacterium]MDE0674979.1 zf-HC2 domain-containing protein [bacterium]
MSKECRQTITYLYGYVDGELEVETEHRLVNHFSYCPPCKNIEIVERRVRYTIRHHLTEEVPEVFMERLKGRLAIERQRLRPQ